MNKRTKRKQAPWTQHAINYVAPLLICIVEEHYPDYNLHTHIREKHPICKSIVPSNLQTRNSHQLDQDIHIPEPVVGRDRSCTLR
jgi:hypothetical protein